MQPTLPPFSSLFSGAPSQSDTVNSINDPIDEPLEQRRVSGEPVVWFEVEDFLRYFDHFSNPTGLQRVSLEIFAEAERLYGHTGRVRFCRLSVYTKKLIPTDFAAVVSAYQDPPGKNAPWTNIWAPALVGKNIPMLLATIARNPKFFLRILKTAFRDLIDLALPQRWFEQHTRPGDIIVSLGASWAIPNYMRHISEAKRRLGVRFAFLLHDLIPLQNKSFVEQWHVEKFKTWLEDAIPSADAIFTTSKQSRDILLQSAADAECPLPALEILELGTGVSDWPLAGEQTAMRLPERFVLFVSTIEIRKNHRLLVRIWQRLVERHGADAIPTLVFAGRTGWLVDDLMAELAASNYVDGKIRLVTDLSDAELHQAYRSCSFTVFPSLSEGWGLPIAESLIHGKACVASDLAPCREIGGDFVDYFDPIDDDDALAKIGRFVLDPGYVAAKEARLRSEYRPRAWADCVHTLLDRLDVVVTQTQSDDSRVVENGMTPAVAYGK
jgi:glycosyltransferase involved in cell wall biosynthesis